MKNKGGMLSSAKTYSIQYAGLGGNIITVETDISNGIHSFSIIGFTDKVVEEARDRVSAAIKHSDFKSPKSQNQKIVISLAPGNIKKTGTLFDVPIALSYLLANRDIKFNVENKIFVGELSLQGEIRAVPGIVSILKYAKENKFEEIYIPYKNKDSIELIDGIKIFAVKTLSELIQHLTTDNVFKPVISNTKNIKSPLKVEICFEDIKGQDEAKRAIIIAVAGGHNLAMYGPPGTGKTLIAKSVQSILPPLTQKEKLEVAAIHSIMSTQNYFHSLPPFRSPHHTSSYAAIVGGGTNLNPGEISLAHRGVLFLDEFPEFDRRVIEALREPLEEKSITITRTSGSVTYPASSILIAAFNPCPCGKSNTNDICICSPTTKINYNKKISGPITDRIDLWTNVNLISYQKLSKVKANNTLETDKAKNLINRARAIQTKRYEIEKISLNGELGANNIDKYIKLSPEVLKILIRAADIFKLSARAYHKVLKCARTIADLAESEEIKKEHILEAIKYKQISF